MASRWNSSDNFSQDSPHCSWSTKSKSSCQKLKEKPKQFTGRIIFMSMFNDIAWGSEDNKKECESSAELVSMYAKSFPAGSWSFLGPGSEEKWCSTHNCDQPGAWDNVAELNPVFRSTSPLSRGVLKSKGGGRLSIHFCADQGTIETIFRIIISVNQLSVYRAVEDLCEECETCHVRTGTPVVMGQFDSWFVPSVTKTHVPLTNDPAQEGNLLQKYQERIEKLSQQERLVKYCTVAGFLTTVEVGHQSEVKGWIAGNTKIGPVLEVTTCRLHGQYGVELRIESIKKDRTHSGVRIYHGLNKMITDLNIKDQDDEQETLDMEFDDSAHAFSCRSKAKAKPQTRTPTSSTTQAIPIREIIWIDVEPQDYWPIDNSVSKKMMNLLPHGKLPREDDGAIEFWRLKDHLQDSLEFSQHWSDEKKKKSTMAKGGGNKKRFQFCTDSSEKILYLRALQGHSGRNVIDPTLQIMY